MKLLVFGCPHVQAGETLGSGALQPTVQWLIQTAQQYQVSHVVCLGDTVDSVAKTDLMTNLTVKWFLDSFKALARTGVSVIWLVGNHDVYSSAYSALDIFEDSHNFIVLKTPKTVSDGVTMTFWPFQTWMDRAVDWPLHREELIAPRAGGEESPRILFTHAPLEGMPMGPVKDDGADMADLALQYDLIFAGHYHVANQFLAKAMSAGTPVVVPGCVIAHTFQDSGWFHGAVLYDTDQSVDHVQWLGNPYSHYFFTGSAAELDAALKNPTVAALRERTHVRLTDDVDTAKYSSQGIPTVQLRPKQEQIKSSGKQSFQLEGKPEDDLKLWLDDAGLDEADALLELGKGYF